MSRSPGIDLGGSWGHSTPPTFQSLPQEQQLGTFEVLEAGKESVPLFPFCA